MALTLTPNYIQDQSRAISEQYTVLPTKALFYDGNGVAVAISDVNFMGSNSQSTEILLFLEGTKDQPKASNPLEETETISRSSLVFEKVVLYYEVYELTPPNTKSIKTKANQILGTYVLNKPVTLEIQPSGLYGGNTSWSSRIFIGTSTSGSLEVKFEEVSSVSQLLKNIQRLIHTYTQTQHSNNDFKQDIRDLAHSFVHKQHVNVPYQKGGKWFLNGKVVGDFTEALNAFDTSAKGIYDGFLNKIENTYNDLNTKITTIGNNTNNTVSSIQQTIQNFQDSTSHSIQDIRNTTNTRVTALEQSIESMNIPNTISGLQNSLTQLQGVVDNDTAKKTEIFPLRENIEQLKVSIQSKMELTRLQEEYNKIKTALDQQTVLNVELVEWIKKLTLYMKNAGWIGVEEWLNPANTNVSIPQFTS